jgi:hypothetical protein
MHELDNEKREIRKFGIGILYSNIKKAGVIL